MTEEAPLDLLAMAPKIYAHKLQRGETIWEVTTRLAGDSRILVVFPDAEKLDEFPDTLTRTRVTQLIVAGGKGELDDLTTRWTEFMRNSNGVCLATQSGLLARSFGMRAFTVYPGLPTPAQFVRYTALGSALIFFEKDEGIAKFERDLAKEVTIDA
jgi:hypothetical protein